MNYSKHLNYSGLVEAKANELSVSSPLSHHITVKQLFTLLIRRLCFPLCVSSHLSEVHEMLFSLELFIFSLHLVDTVACHVCHCQK